MTESEYEEKMAEINKAHEDAKRQLYIDYAASQRKFKIGDIISNGHVTILVEKFGTNKTFGLPQPTYIGKELRKDLTPKKNGSTNTIFGNNHVERIK
jgi:hypothetical protein